MYNLEDYETRMVHDGKRNNREVKIICERCKTEKWVRWSRVKEGLGRFCSLECFNEYQKETDVLATIGKENAKKNFNKSAKRWNVYWHDENRKRYTTSYARWWWEMNKGKIPSGYRASYKDGNPENVDSENIILISKEEYGLTVSNRLLNHDVSMITKIKISKAHTGCSTWKGFVKNKDYPGMTKRLKKFIKERDKYVCQACSEKLAIHSPYNIVHHIDGDKTNQDLDNLILVCFKCHSLIHSKQRVSDTILAFRSALK